MTGYVAAGLCVISGWGNGFVERQASKSEKVKKVSPGTGLVRSIPLKDCLYLESDCFFLWRTVDGVISAPTF